MDKLIKQSIDSRRDAIKASSEIDAGAQAKIDSLFAEIEKLGESCKDVGEFETKFAKSPLNQKYLDFFTDIATNSATKTAAKGAVVGGVKSAAEQAITELGPTRAAVYQKVHCCKLSVQDLMSETEASW